MRVRRLLDVVLTNDALTRGLGDPEARILVEWLTDRIEHLALDCSSESAAAAEASRLCRRGRAIARFISLWCYQRERGAAVQLAAAERFTWPFPTESRIDPCELVHTILQSESSAVAA
jgi:hypothetical protein